MFKLPENKPQVPRDTPRNYFIYGETMSGKSYLANSVPAIQLINARDRSGRITKSVIDQLSEILLALQTQEHTYETVVVDVIDDVIDMIKIAVCSQFGVKSLSEISYGKGYDYFNQALTELVIDLKALPMNVIYISRQISEYDDKGNATKDKPSLKDKYVNLINGNSDLMIHTEKIGNNYNREVDRKRKTYYADQVDDKAILKILQTIRGAVEPAHQKTQTSSVAKTEAKPKTTNDEDLF